MNSLILVVEDDSSIRETIADILTDEGYRVISAENGVKGLELLDATWRKNQEVPRLILLDLNMPEMNGSEFLDRVRALDPWKDVSITVLTAAGNRQRPELADDFIRKPLHLDDLLTMIDRYCA